MTASIRIDDTVNPPQQTTDNPNSFLGVVHTLSNFNDTGVLGHRWTLTDKPIGSSATLTSTSTATTTLTPDIAGNYLVRLETYLDAARTILDGLDEQIAGVKLPVPFDWAIPAAGETTQQSSSRGWAQSRERAIRDVHAFMNSGIPQLTGASNGETNILTTEIVLGGFVFDPSDIGLAPIYELLGVVVSAAGSGELRLYDLGAPGTPEPAVRRSTLVIPNVDAGDVVQKQQALTVAAAPGVDADEIFGLPRIYEVRMFLNSGAGGDTLKIHWAGVKFT